MSGRDVAAIILAAGASTRLGEPKQLVRIAGETLLERAVRAAREAGCSPIVVVLGAEAERIAEGCQLGDARVVVNFDWEEGMASSIAAGLEAIAAAAAEQAPGVDGAVLMTCDQPTVSAEHLRSLFAAGVVTGSSYAGRAGVPGYFPAASFPALLGLTGDAGARELLREAAAVELPGGEVDVDTPAELERVRERFA